MIGLTDAMSVKHFEESGNLLMIAMIKRMQPERACRKLQTI